MGRLLLFTSGAIRADVMPKNIFGDYHTSCIKEIPMVGNYYYCGDTVIKFHYVCSNFYIVSGI